MSNPASQIQLQTLKDEIYRLNSVSPATTPWTKEEKLIIALVAAVQFIHIVDFMMVMPLGPDFSRTIGMDASLIGIVGGAYTLAAAISTLLCFRFLDRFDRKKSLIFAVLGLALTTGLTALASDYHSLLFFRGLAGFFGGPVTALALATVTDAIPEEKRGRALGLVMAAFSAAAVIGLPIGLELARFFSWPTTFVVVALATAFIALLIHLKLPEIKTQKSVTATALTLHDILNSRRHQFGLGVMFISVFSIFLLIPHLSAYWQFNRGYPRDQLGLLYMAGGVTAFFLSRAAGALIDSKGAMTPLVIFTSGLIAITFIAFTASFAIPVFIIFISYMGLAAGRSVPAQMLSTMVPAPHQRAGYMSLQSATQSLGSGTASVISSVIISTNADQTLNNIPIVSMLSILALVLLMWLSSKLTAELQASR